MYIVAPSPVDTIRADFRRVTRGPMLHRVWHFLQVERERATDRAAARGVRGQSHPGIYADYETARRMAAGGR
jgi:hypothetical protein